MGRWWKDTVFNPPEDAERKVTFEGDSEALSKKWPILWRFYQNWRIIRVASSGGFRLYFQSTNGQRMVYRWPIFKDYVAVRVGPEEVTFWAVSAGEQEYTPLKVVDMGVWIPGRFRNDTRENWDALRAIRLAKQAEFV
jgi:hypothetical protein